MNIRYDEYGPINVDDITSIHNAKMARKMETRAHHDGDKKSGHTTRKTSIMMPDGGLCPQECVRDMRFNSSYEDTEGKNNGHTHSWTYAEVVAE